MSGLCRLFRPVAWAAWVLAWFTASALAQVPANKTAEGKPATNASKPNVKTLRSTKAESAKTQATNAVKTLSDSQLELAKRVHVGRMACELGQVVQLAADERNPGYFDLNHAGKQYRLAPVEARTGAVRLEDARGQFLWMQLGNKSMFMDQKLGKRMVDECASPEQMEAARYLKSNPSQSLLETAKPATVEARNDTSATPTPTPQNSGAASPNHPPQ